MSFDFHSLFLHAFINWYQVLGLRSLMTYSVHVYSSNRLQGDVCIYRVCVPYWNVIYILSCLYFLFLCNRNHIATWTTCINMYNNVFCEINYIYSTISECIAWFCMTEYHIRHKCESLRNEVISWKYIFTYELLLSLMLVLSIWSILFLRFLMALKTSSDPAYWSRVAMF